MTGSSDLNAGAGAIILTDSANDFQGTVTLTGAATRITDKNALTLGTVTTGDLTAVSNGALNLGTGSVAGTLDASSNGGALGAAIGGLTVTGSSNFNAGAGAIILTDAGNDFQGPVTLTGQAAQISDKNALTLGTVNTGNLTVSANGALDLGTGSVTGTLSASSLGSASARTVLAAAGTGGAISEGAAGLTVTGTSSLNAGSVDLSSASNDFQGAVSATGNDITLTDKSNLTIDKINATDTATLSAAGSIAGVTGGTNINSVNFTASATSGMDLALNANNVTATSSGTGDITLHSAGSVNLLNVSAANGNVNVANTTGNINVYKVSGENVTLHAVDSVLSGDSTMIPNITALAVTTLIANNGTIGSADKALTEQSQTTSANAGGVDSNGQSTFLQKMQNGVAVPVDGFNQTALSAAQVSIYNPREDALRLDDASRTPDQMAAANCYSVEEYAASRNKLHVTGAGIQLPPVQQQ